MKKYEVEGHVPSYLPEDREWKLVWHDEFDGPELDLSKWSFRLNFWGKRFDAFTDQGIVFDGNSNIELHRTEKDGYYVSPQLQTGALSFDNPAEVQENPWGHNSFWPLAPLDTPKFMHTYGYYECRCKFQKDPKRWWSAFWVQAPATGTHPYPEYCGIENDIMEYVKENNPTTGNIMGGYGTNFVEEGRVEYFLDKTEDDFHTFAMDWSEDGYVFYCDGKEVSRASEHVSRIPQFILLTTEIQGYRKNCPEKVGDKFEDDAFIVDYVRVFDRV